MAEGGTFGPPDPEPDIMALEEALYAQQQLLQRLHAELDAEREASSTAASEALSMILRLQGEKASLKMEASQYKRMAEEKMCHAEEALAVFEDLIYQRELEIASLEFQVQAYRYRLLSMGCNDLGVYENKFPENLLMQRTDALFIEKGGNGNNIRRLNSLPPLDANQMKENSISEKKPVSLVNGDLNSYWEQIKKFDECVKVISDNKDSGRLKPLTRAGGTWSPTLFSQASVGTRVDAKKILNTKNSDRPHEDMQEHKGAVGSDDSSNVQDIFEVTQTSKSCESCESCRVLPLKGKRWPGKLDLVNEEDALGSLDKDKIDHTKNTIPRGRGEKRLPIPRTLTINSAFLPMVNADSRGEYQQLSQRIERLERVQNSPRLELIREGDEELNLLKEIHEQLKCIRSEMRSLRAVEHMPDNPSLDPLREAMLSFWI